MESQENYLHPTKQSLEHISNMPTFKGSTKLVMDILALVATSMETKLSETGAFVIANEILHDFPNASMDEIKHALMEGAKGHYHSYKPGIYMPLNITTVYHWLELKLKNVNKAERMVL